MSHHERIWLLTLPLVCSLHACSFRTMSVYEQPASADTLSHVGNFYSVDIWNDYITNEFWFSPDTAACLQVTNAFDLNDNGNGSLLLQWNKQAGCSWLGIGFGWDGWASKNLSQIVDRGAIQFMARSSSGNLKGLPWAMALEDYNGAQAWAGVFPEFIDNQEITGQWTRVQVPLKAFDTKMFHADLSMVKQLIIQLEADGVVYIDDVRVVDLGEHNNRSVDISYNGSSRTLLDHPGASVQMALTDSSIVLTAVVEDAIHVGTSSEEWPKMENDGLILAFSSNPDLDNSRKQLFLSDRLLFLPAMKNGLVWDDVNRQTLARPVLFEKTASGYRLTAELSFRELGISKWEQDENYLLDVAVVDRQSSELVVRYRWNGDDKPAFERNPSTWGSIHVTSELSAK